MRTAIKKIIFVIVLLSISFSFLLILNNFSCKKNYRYLTYENDWGYSENCYQDKMQRAICISNNEIIYVKQYEVLIDGK